VPKVSIVALGVPLTTSYCWITQLRLGATEGAAPGAAPSWTMAGLEVRRIRKTTRQARGFTLVEVAIVVTIIAILAGASVSRFINMTEDAKESALRHNVAHFRVQIEFYKLHHLGKVPQLRSGTLPQMTAATNQKGEIGPPGPSFPRGPYFPTGIPANPVTGKNAIAATSTFPPSSESGQGGWLYHQPTGKLAPDLSQFFSY